MSIARSSGPDSPSGAGELPVVQEHDVPAEIRALSTIAEPDYVDLFTLTTGDASTWSPEQWARAAFEDAAGLGGQVVFRVFLGLRLAWRASPSQVAGWRAAAPDAMSVRLAARSWMITSELVVRVVDTRVQLATFMRYDRRMGRRVWTPLSGVHRGQAAGLLRDAHRALRSP